MTIIALEGMAFYAYHGYYDIEREKGNHYNLEISVGIEDYTSTADDIMDSVNYEGLYEICQKHMLKKYKLIETLGVHIANDVKASYSSILNVTIRIEKLNPPIDGDVKKAVVIIQM